MHKLCFLDSFKMYFCICKHFTFYDNHKVTFLCYFAFVLNVRLFLRLAPEEAAVGVPRIPQWAESERNDTLLKIQMDVRLKTGVCEKTQYKDLQGDITP